MKLRNTDMLKWTARAYKQLMQGRLLFRLVQSNVSTCVVMTPKANGGILDRNQPWTALPVAEEM